MRQVGWFPRFSPDGSLHTWERPGYWRAQYLNPTREIADNGVTLVVDGQPIDAPTCSELGAGGGVWAACRTDPVRVFTSDGRTIPGAGCPAVNPDGRIAYVDDRQADVKNLIFDLEPVSRGAITDVRVSRTALVWRNHGRVWGARLGGTLAAQELQVAAEEFGPVPIDTPIGPWVLCYTQTGLILRPFGESLGYRFDNGGQTYFPDAVYRDGGILAIFTNDRGEQSTQPFDLHAPRVPLGSVDRQDGPLNNQPEVPVSVVNKKAELAAFWQSWNGSQPITDDAEKHRFTAAFTASLGGRVGRKARPGTDAISKDTLGYWRGDTVPTSPTDGTIDAFDLIASSGVVSWDLRAEQGDPLYHEIQGRWFPATAAPQPQPGPTPAPGPIPAPAPPGLDEAAIRRIVQDELRKPRPVALKSPLGKYVCEDRNVPAVDGSKALLANRDGAASWETFTLEPR